MSDTPVPVEAPAVSPQPSSAPPLAYETDEFTSLDPRSLEVARIVNWIGFAIILSLIAVPALIWSRSGAAVSIMGALFVGMLALAVWSNAAYEPRAYRAWGYRLDERVLVIRQGVWWKTFRLLPLNRLQHADLKIGPIQRRFGLATLVVHTAGTHESAIEIPGLALEEATRLRDHLVAVGGDDGV